MKRKAKINSQDKKQETAIGKMDEAIIHCMEQHPDIQLKNIPTELVDSGRLLEEVPYPTLQRHVSKLVERKVVSRNYSVNWALAGYTVRYRVGILIDPKELRDKAIKDKKYDSQKGLADYIIKELAQAPPFKNELVVEDVFILLGGNVDLAVDFYAKDDKTATQFIIDNLRRLPGISNTVSSKLVYSSKHGWLGKNGKEVDS